MGRVKLPISRILNNTNRQVTYSKRRNGILKKAYEIAVLCDIDIALIMISPSGRITYFSGTRRIEDVMLQYFNLSDDEIELDQDSEGLVHDREGVRSALMRLKTEAAALQSPNNLSKYVEEIMNLQHQLETAKEQLRAFEPDLPKLKSLDELQSCEEKLLNTLNFIEQRKKYLLSKHTSSYNERVDQIHPTVGYTMNIQAESPLPNRVMHFNYLLEHLNKHDINGHKYMHVGSETPSAFDELRCLTTNVPPLSEPILHNGMCKFNSISYQSPQNWSFSTELYSNPALWPPEVSQSLNEIHVPDAASRSPLQYTQPS